MKDLTNQSKQLLVTAVPSGRRASAGAMEFRIVAFPKEFQKNYWRTLDRRMLMIFCLSLTMLYGSLISMALRPKHEIATQMDVRTAEKLRQVLKVDAKIYEPIDQPLNKDKEEPEKADPRGKRSGLPRNSSERNSKYAAAKEAAQKRADKAMRDAGAQGILAVVGVESEDGKYRSIDLKGNSNNLSEVLSQINSLSMASDENKKTELGKKIIGSSGEIAAWVTELESNGGISTFAGDAGGSLIVGVANIASNSAAVSVGAIQSVIDQQAAAVNSCYQKELKNSPDLKGKLSLQIKVNPSGRVAGVSVNSNTVGGAVQRCVENKIRGWEFPKGKRGIVTVSQTFIFTR